MSGIPSVSVVFFFSCLALSIAVDSSWIVLSDLKDVPSPLTKEASHELLLKELSKKSVPQMIFELRNEFYTMATGKDWYGLVADETQNKEFHAISEACLALIQKLPHMGFVHHVLRKAIAHGALTANTHKNITKAFPVIKENIEKGMVNHSASNEEYKRLKSEALAKPRPADYKIYYYEIPKTLDDAKVILAQGLNDPYLKKLMVVSSFGNETRRNTSYSAESYALAKSILELSKDPELGAKVQTLFDEALTETANKVEDVDAKNVGEKHIKETFIQIAIEFFKTLASKFENDPTVKTKFAEMKEKISKSR